MALFKISKLNPLHFVDMNPTVNPMYHHRHIDDFDFPSTILFWEYPADWQQPWQRTTDSIRLQVRSEIGPIKASLVDPFGAIHWSGNLAQKQQDFFNPSWYIYELDLKLSAIPTGLRPGFYRMVLEFGSPVSNRVWSNLLVIGDVIEDTIIATYFHHKYFEDVYFETGIKFQCRVWGTLKYEKPGSRNQQYENQRSDMTSLSSKPFDLWRFWLGSSEGVPDFIVPKWNRYIGCRYFFLDRRQYCRATEGEQFEKSEEKDVVLHGWTIELRDVLNRASNIFWDGIGNPPGSPENPDPGGVTDPNNPLPETPGGQVQGSAIAMIPIEVKGFTADGSGGGVFAIVQDID